MIVDGIIFSFGLLRTPLIDHFGGVAVENEVAWVGSMQAGFYLLAGLIR
jgi:hypothetical protein